MKARAGYQAKLEGNLEGLYTSDPNVAAIEEGYIVAKTPGLAIIKRRGSRRIILKMEVVADPPVSIDMVLG